MTNPQLTYSVVKSWKHLIWDQMLQASDCFQFSSVQLLSHVQLFVIPWTAAHQASLSITNSQSLLKLMSIESMMPHNHLILCCPFLLLPSIFPSIRVFLDQSVLCIRQPKYWSFSISPSKKYSGLICFRMDNSKNKKMKLNNLKNKNKNPSVRVGCVWPWYDTDNRGTLIS